jgi:hypothetical protein
MNEAQGNFARMLRDWLAILTTSYTRTFMRFFRKRASLTVLALASSVSMAGATVNIHVSPRGNDANRGTTDQPVASLAAAQKLERQAARHEPVNVILHRGTYYLPETVIFNPEDSGKSNAPVIWQAAEGESPVISGGERLNLIWIPYTNIAGVFQARVPADLAIDQLFVNGQRQWMARFPNRESGNGLNVFDTWKLDHNAKPDSARDPLAKSRIARWANPTGAFLHAMHPALWGDVSWRITGKNLDGSLAMEGGTQNNRGSAIHPLYRYVENVFEELDAPGEWFYDHSSRTLYYYPQPEVDLAKADIEIVRLRHLLELSGSQTRPVKWLEFHGLTFRNSARTFMDTKEPLLRSDWTIYRGGAVVLTGTEDCQVTDCTFDQVGGNAVFVNNYNRRAAVRGCRIAEAGANGVCFVGSPNAVRNPLFNYDQRLKPADLDLTPGPRTDEYPADCSVEDCLIYGSGRFEKQTAGVEIAMAQSITVRHCSIYDVPRAGINIGDGCWGGHVIEFCDVFDTVKETGDHGSFNSWGRDRFWLPGREEVERLVKQHPDLPLLDVVKPIVLRNNRWRCDHGWDIDLDDGSSNYQIRNNLCLNGGIKNREGYHRLVENNVIVASGFHPHVWFGGGHDVFRRNLIASPAYFPALMGRVPWGAEMDFNLVCVPGKTDIEHAVELAKQSRRDEHSIIADPEFVDPVHGDFRVRADSPALKLGFVNFPMKEFGVQKAALKAIARTPSFVTPTENSAALMFSATTQWLGAKVKTLETLPEASSVGVPLNTGGVLVLELADNCLAAKRGLQRGDLIVAMGNKQIKNVTDLQKYGPPGDSLEIVRNQRRQIITRAQTSP